MSADVADVYYPAFLINGEEKVEYPEFKPGEKVRLRIIDGSASTSFWMAFGGPDPLLVSADGKDVVPVKHNKTFIGVAETYDFIVTIPENGKLEYKIMAQDGSGTATAYLGQGPIVAAPDVSKPDKIGMMQQMAKMKMKMGAPALKFRPGKDERYEMKEKWGMQMEGMKDMDMGTMNMDKSNMKGMEMKKHKMDEMQMDMKKDSMQMDHSKMAGMDTKMDTKMKKASQMDDMKMDEADGMQGMNMFNVQEKTWGNRFIIKSALDNAEWGVASADMGIGISKRLGFGVLASLFMTNGEGYKESDVDDENKISVQFVMGEKKLNKQDGYNLGLVYSTLEDVTVTGFFGGWAGNGLRIGIENNSEDDDGITNDLTSIYANYKINDSLSAFVRMDDVERNNDGNAEEETMAGLIWTPTKGLDICVNSTSQTINNVTEDTAKLNFQFKF